MTENKLKICSTDVNVILAFSGAAIEEEMPKYEAPAAAAAVGDCDIPDRTTSPRAQVRVSGRQLPSVSSSSWSSFTDGYSAFDNSCQNNNVVITK